MLTKRTSEFWERSDKLLSVSVGFWRKQFLVELPRLQKEKDALLWVGGSCSDSLPCSSPLPRLLGQVRHHHEADDDVDDEVDDEVEERLENNGSGTN